MGAGADALEATNSVEVPPRRRALADGLLAWLRSHPVVCLAVLTPGIPEYLSSSSPLINLALNPARFFAQLAINVAQYTAGALLIREAVVRWRKGWATVFLLATAYAVAEEGIGDETLVNSAHGAEGVLGAYGRFAGVNWVWTTGVVAFHTIYSIGLPLLLLGLANPSTRGRSLIGARGVAVAFGSLVASTSVESLLVFRDDHFWIGLPLLASALAAIGALVYASHRIRAGALSAPSDRPHLTPRAAILFGFFVFPVVFLLEYGGAATGIPAGAVVAGELAFFVLALDYIRRRIGRIGHQSLLVELAFGFVLWQSAFGVLVTWGLPYTLPLVGLAVAFFVRLRRRYARPKPSTPPVDAAAP